jgi:hypothetical protein
MVTRRCALEPAGYARAVGIRDRGSVAPAFGPSVVLLLPIEEERSDERDDHGHLVEQDENPSPRTRVDEWSLPSKRLVDVEQGNRVAEVPDVEACTFLK